MIKKQFSNAKNLNRINRYFFAKEISKVEQFVSYNNNNQNINIHFREIESVRERERERKVKCERECLRLITCGFRSPLSHTHSLSQQTFFLQANVFQVNFATESFEKEKKRKFIHTSFFQTNVLNERQQVRVSPGAKSQRCKDLMSLTLNAKFLNLGQLRTIFNSKQL